MFEHCGRRTDGQMLVLGYTISSPCEPVGSGELLIIGGYNLCFEQKFNQKHN